MNGIIKLILPDVSKNGIVSLPRTSLTICYLMFMTGYE